MAAIVERQHGDRLYDEYWKVWQTKTIAQYVAATVAIPEGETNELLEQANDIGKNLLGNETNETKEPIEVREEQKPQGRKEMPDAPPPMSKEQLERIADKNGSAATFRFSQVMNAKGAGMNKKTKK